MVRLFFSLISASLAANDFNLKSFLADYIVPPEVVQRELKFEDDAYDVLREVFDQILRNRGYDEEALAGLPSFIVSHHNVTMRDGVNINTLLVKNPLDPLGLKKRPAVISRSPYGTLGTNAVSLVFSVLNGFNAVIQDQRGTQKSEGTYDLWTLEPEDSTDVAEWVASQHWSNGEVFYVGASADGVPGNMATRGDPSRMKGEWEIWTASKGHSFAYPQGAYRFDLMHGYLDHEAGDTHGASRDIVLPKIESKESYDSWWASKTLCRDASNPSEECFFSKINWPIIDSVGWWDIFQNNHLFHWKGIRAMSDESVRDQHVLIVGPLGHCLLSELPTKQVALAIGEADALVVAAETASEIFAGNFSGKVRSNIGRVNLFVMGSFHGVSGASGNYWTSLDDFPDPEPAEFYLGAEGSLDLEPPTVSSTKQYVYDPSAEDGATPMLGGNNLPGIGNISVCGTADQISKANRTDILIFDSEPLSEEMAIAGELSAQLFVGSSAKDTDFVVTVEDLAPDKTSSMLVRYGAARMRWNCGDEFTCSALEADRVYPIEINLWATAYIFPKGHSVRVTVSSAAYPYYSLNPNTGNALFAPDDQPVAATNSIHISPSYPSRVSLPKVSASDIPENPNFHPVIPQTVVV